jgi:glutamate formiminotransferase / 5-formyltetrahydrofolate cyclo-ligase
VLECVPNVAEGRDRVVLDALAAASGPSLLDRHVDPDHHRSVFTLAGPGAGDALAATRALAGAAAARLDLRQHAGAHPRFGVLDVMPFVALGEPADAAAEPARAFASWLAAELGVPSFLYGAADPGRRSLPELRRAAAAGGAPDVGPDRPDPRLGVAAVGARPPLVAVNCWLGRPDLALARAIAAGVRERDGGLPGIRALAFELPSRRAVQVSLNVTDLAATGIEAACTAVRTAAEAAETTVERVEWVGLVPEAELERCAPGFLRWSGLDRSRTIEARVAGAAGR